MPDSETIQTLCEHSLQINGARLNSCLQKKLREKKLCQEEFKCELDHHLSTIPDQPRLGKLIPEAVFQVSGK